MNIHYDLDTENPTKDLVLVNLNLLLSFLFNLTFSIFLMTPQWTNVFQDKEQFDMSSFL